MGYAFPVGDIYVPSDWADHKYRNPPSAEPGTDYASGYGTPVVAAFTGTITDLKNSTSGGTGRYVTITGDDGRWHRDLHLSAIYVQVGFRVTKGQSVIAASGASGYGSEWYYGAHVHHTLGNSGASLANSIDFEDWVGGDDPQPPDPPDPPEEDVNVNAFSKKLALGTDGTTTIPDGQSAWLYLDSGKTNSKLVTGPDLNVDAVLSITFRNLPLPYVGDDGSIVVPESVQVEPFISIRQADGSIKDSSLHRQEVPASPGLTRAKVPISAVLTNDDYYLRVKVYAPTGMGGVTVAEAYLRGAEYVKS